MNTNFLKGKFSIYLCLALSIMLPAFLTELNAQCTTCGNSYLNVSDKDAIDYDNVVSTFHSTMARQADGSVWIWGEQTASNGTSHNVTPADLKNYPLITNKPILKFTAASNSINNAQFVVLVADGLYVWGTRGVMVASSLTTNTTIQKLTTGLPSGVSPTDVKMLFGTYQTLALLTCGGEVWVLSQDGNVRGNGNTGNSSTWYKVQYANNSSNNNNGTLSNVVALRGAPGGLMALKKVNATTYEVWTWGRAWLGINNTNEATYSRARKMTLPTFQGTGHTPKMIGMSGTTSNNTKSHYILGTDGFIYSLGYNGSRQLGDRTITYRDEWVRVQSDNNVFLGDIAWISTNEHDNAGDFAVNALTNDGKLWSWGENERNMIGGTNDNTNYDPFTGHTGIGATDRLIAVETGGHTSMVVKDCEAKFGYVGHRINGSMGNGAAAEAYVSTYSFATTSLNICGASTGSATIAATGPFSTGQTYPLILSPAGGTLTLLSGNATLDPVNLTLKINAPPSTIKVKYTVTTRCGLKSDTLTITPDAITLPVVFDKLEAFVTGSQLFVNWTTNSETNNSHFEIEASADGKTFTKIGQVQSKAVNGNSGLPLSYDYSTSLSGIALSALPIALLLLGAVYRRRKMLAVALLAASLISMMYSCNKTSDAIPEDGKKIFIRVVQVDLDGTSVPSKVVQAQAR